MGFTGTRKRGGAWRRPGRGFTAGTMVLGVLCGCPPRVDPTAALRAEAPPPTRDGRARPESAQVRPAGFGPSDVEFHTGGADAVRPLPVVILLHGLGDTPAGIAPLLRSLATPARVVALGAPEDFGRGGAWFTVRVREGPPEELAAALAAATDRLAARVEAIARAQGASDVVVTGFSQGGLLSFALAVRHPRLVRAAIPIGGLLPEPLWPTAAPPSRAPPIVALHGTEDEVVPFERAVATVEALGAAGFEVRLDRYPGVAHAISPAMHADVLRAVDAALAAPPR